MHNTMFVMGQMKDQTYTQTEAFQWKQFCLPFKHLHGSAQMHTPFWFMKWTIHGFSYKQKRKKNTKENENEMKRHKEIKQQKSK